MTYWAMTYWAMTYWAMTHRHPMTRRRKEQP